MRRIGARGLQGLSWVYMKGRVSAPPKGPSSGTTSSAKDFLMASFTRCGEGFPDGIVYTLWRWIPDKSPEPLIKGVSFDKRGVLVCSGKPGYCSGDGPDDPINIKTTATLGEMKRLAVVSEDGKIVAFADAVPFPIEASDKGCKLSVVRMSALADTVIARATGLKGNQALTVTTSYGNEGATTKSNTSGPNGTWQEIVAARGTKQPSGKASISVSDGACTVSVTFDYGPGSNKPQ